MRSFIISIATLLLLTFSVLAQQDVYKWKVGVSGGLLTEGNKITYPNAITSYFYGVQAQFGMSPSFSGRVELTKSYLDKRPLHHDSRLILGVVYNFDNHRILSERAKVAPYLMLGGGYSSYTRSYAELAITNGDWNAAGEIGVKFRMSDRFDLNLFSSLHYPINSLNFIRFGAGGLVQRFGLALNLNMGLRKSKFNAPSYYIGRDHEVFNPTPAKRSLLVAKDTVPAAKNQEPVWGYAAASEDEYEVVEVPVKLKENSDSIAQVPTIDSTAIAILDSAQVEPKDSIVQVLPDSIVGVTDSLIAGLDTAFSVAIVGDSVLLSDSVFVMQDSLQLNPVPDSLGIPAVTFSDSLMPAMAADSVALSDSALSYQSDSLIIGDPVTRVDSTQTDYSNYQRPDFADLPSRPPNAFQMGTSTPTPVSSDSMNKVDPYSNYQRPDFANLPSRPPNAFQMGIATPTSVAPDQASVGNANNTGQIRSTASVPAKTATPANTQTLPFNPQLQSPYQVAQPQYGAYPQQNMNQYVPAQQAQQPYAQYSGAINDPTYQQRYAQQAQAQPATVQNYYYPDPNLNQAPVNQPASYSQNYSQGVAQPAAGSGQYGNSIPNYQAAAPGNTVILPQLAGRSQGMTFKDTLMFEMMRSMQVQLNQLKAQSQPQIQSPSAPSANTDELLIRELVAAYKDMNGLLKEQLQKAENGSATQKPVSQTSPTSAAVSKHSEASVTGNSVELFFDPNSWALDAEKREIINQWISGLNERSKLVVTGTADSAGDKEYNKKVSRYRAEAVYNHLRSKGIADSRISLRYTGEEYATGPSNKDDRRVTIEVIIIK